GPVLRRPRHDGAAHDAAHGRAPPAPAGAARG
ncbi:MAG: hypothetical protein AVDCRST_MAG66-2453, partial [uncultured Pseudonocardia sp.]